MKFRTIVEIKKSKADISYRDNMMMFGSCFVENIGEKLRELKFRIDVNPFGVLYNPESIRKSIVRLLDRRIFVETDVFERDGVWNSFCHHSRFAALSASGFLEQANRTLLESADRLEDSTVLFLTFGTAWVYRLKSTGEVVSNCHKLPASLFVRERLEIEYIVSSYRELISALLERRTKLLIVFTVSPIRHWKDGAHENQISKATLMLAMERLQALFPENVFYFPAYEMVMDELRDYRFYAEDMLHPSDMAIQYIWERFSETYFSEETRQTAAEVAKLMSALRHRPFNPQSESFENFEIQTKVRIEAFRQRNPQIDF